jgi:hypothetical protein
MWNGCPLIRFGDFYREGSGLKSIKMGLNFQGILTYQLTKTNEKA